MITLDQTLNVPRSELKIDVCIPATAKIKLRSKGCWFWFEPACTYKSHHIFNCKRISNILHITHSNILHNTRSNIRCSHPRVLTQQGFLLLKKFTLMLTFLITYNPYHRFSTNEAPTYCILTQEYRSQPVTKVPIPSWYNNIMYILFTVESHCPSSC